VSDAEHELLMAHNEQVELSARLRSSALRAARAAVAAQDRADGRHEAWLDDLIGELTVPSQ
jgi:hypothetical protein